MHNILEEIVTDTRLRVEKKKQEKSFETIKSLAQNMDSNTGFPFEQALKTRDIAFICEVKRASPSKGLIAKEFPYLTIAQEYEKAGASAISVLTEPKYFRGDDRYLREIAETVKIPVLRKDFTIDSYQIYEAKRLGASAILLICAILTDKDLQKFIQIADSLGLSAVVEAHNEEEVHRAIVSGARIIGINNRNLVNFTVDIHNSLRYRSLIPDHILFISESGIRAPEQIAELRTQRTNAVLIGETFMLCKDKTAELRRLQGVTYCPKIKLCGIRREEDVTYANEYQPDYVGFVFAPTKRNISKQTALELRKKLNPKIKTVGVFVNEKNICDCRFS